MSPTPFHTPPAAHDIRRHIRDLDRAGIRKLATRLGVDRDELLDFGDLPDFDLSQEVMARLEGWVHEQKVRVAVAAITGDRRAEMILELRIGEAELVAFEAGDSIGDDTLATLWRYVAGAPSQAAEVTTFGTTSAELSPDSRRRAAILNDLARLPLSALERLAKQAA